jgi:flagellar biosynthesis protein FliR
MVQEIEIVKLFMLVAIRISGLIVTAPVLGSNNFPAMAKVGLIGMTAYLVTPTLAALPEPIPAEGVPFAFMAAGELLIGMAMGLAMTIVFAAIQLAGQIMDMQSGFGLMNVFNPALETQFPIFGFFYFIVAVLFLLATYGHHLMIVGLVSSFERIPVGGFNPDQGVFGHMVSLGGAMFYDGVLIAAPVAAAMMVAYMVMGIMGRVVPQIHLFVIGFPLTIATSLAIVAFSIGIYLGFLEVWFEGMFISVDRLIDGLG